MREVEIEAMDLERLTGILSTERADRLRNVAGRARELLDGRIVWNVNATAHGGGVAEMLQTLLSYGRGIGVDTRWLVLSGNPDFFAVTKRVHNMLHGEPGDGGPLGDDEHAVFTETLRANLDQMLPRVRAGDLVILHDPQTAGMVDALRAVGAKVSWRCHIGRDMPNEVTDRGWAFLRPLVQNADSFIFSRAVYAPDWMSRDILTVIPPSIDPLNAKNRPMTEVEIDAALTRASLLGSSEHHDGTGFQRRDGSRGAVRRHTGLVLDGPPPPRDARVVVQVSRWDRLKDMAGVITGFTADDAALPDDVHLMLVGPDVSGVSDDPEGAAVLAECRRIWGRLTPAQQARVHLVCLPMDDIAENAYLVNALQRRASVVVQKSIAEGFGITVTEAMWKARPVVASAVGGIQDQIIDGQHGLLIGDPHDLHALAAELRRLLNNPELAHTLGTAARERVHDRYLGDRHLEQYFDVFSTMLGIDTPPTAPPMT